jgi:nucleoside-diphosphate-sugar epimerase
LKRVLLTGAGGYIGRHMLDDLLARGFEVHAVSRAPKTGEFSKSKSVVWHAIDLLDSSATAALLAKVHATHLIHLAWTTEPGTYWQSPENNDWLRASVEILESFSEHGGQRVLLTGTCAEYDWTDGHCIEDETPLRAKSLYAESKLAFREAAFALEKSSDLSVAWVRVFFSFGPNERAERFVPAVILAFLAGDRAKCSDGSLLRDFMYVPDVSSAAVAILESNFSGDINVASGDAVTLEDIVHRIAARLDAADRIDFGHYPRRAADPQKITADISRLRDSIDWTPKYDLDSAIDHTIAWWRSQAQ